MKTIVTSSVFVAIFLFLETAILSNMYFLPVVPDLLLIFVLYISVHRGSFEGETTGFISGLCLDFLSSSPLGLNALVRTIIGFTTGCFYLTIKTSGFIIPIILGILGTVYKAVIYLVLSFFFPNTVYNYELLSSTLLIECVINGLLSPIFFLVFSQFTSISLKTKDSINGMGSR